MNFSNITQGGKKFLDYFNKGQKRSVVVKKNVVGSFILKFINNLINLLLVPVILTYLNPTEYGIWLTLSSVIAWISFFNIGVTISLKNKFAEAIAENNQVMAQKYVSASYFLSILFITLIYIFFLIVNPYLNWVKILNAPETLSQDLYNLVLIVFTFFSIQFILRVINSIVEGDQKNFITELINTLSSVFSLTIVIILIYSTKKSLVLLGLTLSAIPAILLFFATVILFRKTYKEFIPNIKLVNTKISFDLLKLGGQFFVIQIAGLILFSTDNIIIAQLFEPSEVTPYNIAFKYFNILSVFYFIIINPFWAAFTDAYVKKDFNWIKKVVNKIIKFWSVLFLIVIIMLIFANKAYLIWVGDSIQVPILVSVFMAIFTLILTWNSVFVFFLNSIGAIKLQTYYSIIAAFINIPLSIFLAKNLNFGSAGVIMATCICLFPSSFIWTIQYKKIISLNTHAIWEK